MTTTKQSEQTEARETLRSLLPPGSTLYTVLRHVSRSGMSRRIDLYAIVDNKPRWLSGYAKTALGYARSKHDAITVGGCGMDMGFHLVSNLSRVLYPEGFGCTGDEHGNRCPSNDHSNGDRDRRVHEVNVYPHWHRSGDYAIKQEWL